VCVIVQAWFRAFVVHMVVGASSQVVGISLLLSIGSQTLLHWCKQNISILSLATENATYHSFEKSGGVLDFEYHTSAAFFKSSV
jgi:hypothetical protein